MDPNQPSTSRGTTAGAAKKPWRGGRGGAWRPWYNRNNSAPREKPTSIQIPADNSTNSLNRTAQSINGFFICDNPTDGVDSFGWKLYFTIDYREATDIRKKIEIFKKHYQTNVVYYDRQQIKENLWFRLTITNLMQDERFQSSWPQFQQDLIEHPEETLNCAGLAMYQIVAGLGQPQLSQLSTNSCTTTNTTINLHQIRARIDKPGPVDNLRALNSSNYRRLFSVRGTIMRASGSKIIFTWIAFQCHKCGAKQVIKQMDGNMTYPTSCATSCRARSNFIPLLTSPYTQSEMFQMVRLQESMEIPVEEKGRVPRTIEVCLYYDLVDTVCPGDDITLTGIPKVQSLDDKSSTATRHGSGEQGNLHKIYLEGISIVYNKNFRVNRKHDFTERDLKAFDVIKSEPCPFRLLVHSLCPNIHGHELVKAGLILGLFGGSSNAHSSNRRNAIHVLMIGDPGIGKSQMLLACANAAPRGLFISGTASSTAGLTVSVRYEKGSSGVLEAGALVLTDQGICCIDEFDKMSSNQHALLEVMEQQTVSISKAAVQCKLPARTSILAAANPLNGFYNKAKTIKENIRINPALLSRFDIIFILIDHPDPIKDRLLTAHIQALHARASSSSGSVTSSAQSKWSYRPNIHRQNSQFDRNHENQSLAEHLTLGPNEKVDILPQIIMQKYIVYARKHINPTLSPEAAGTLKEFYMQLRHLSLGNQMMPVTIRQLEGLVRLTQARARLELCEVASRRHAADVLEIVQFSLSEILTANVSMAPLPTTTNSSKMGQTSQIKRFYQLLQTNAMALNKTVFSIDELKKIGECGGIHSMNFSHILDTMNERGYLLKKGRNLYKFQMD